MIKEDPDVLGGGLVWKLLIRFPPCIDKMGVFQAAAGRPLGEVWTTHSHISGLVFGIILAADMRTTYYLGPSKAGFGPKVRVLYYAT